MTETKSEVRKWQDTNGKEHSFTINFKGGCTITQSYEYVCLRCQEHVVLKHKRSDDMTNRKCIKCEGNLSRYISAPPALDADFHDSCRSYNIGWSEENGI